MCVCVTVPSMSFPSTDNEDFDRIELPIIDGLVSCIVCQSVSKRQFATINSRQSGEQRDGSGLVFGRDLNIGKKSAPRTYGQSNL